MFSLSNFIFIIFQLLGFEKRKKIAEKWQEERKNLADHKKKINLNIDEFILEMRVNSGDFAH
jgi:hypothetical protein